MVSCRCKLLLYPLFLTKFPSPRRQGLQRSPWQGPLAPTVLQGRVSGPRGFSRRGPASQEDKVLQDSSRTPHHRGNLRPDPAPHRPGERLCCPQCFFFFEIYSRRWNRIFFLRSTQGGEFFFFFFFFFLRSTQGGEITIFFFLNLLKEVKSQFTD